MLSSVAQQNEQATAASDIDHYVARLAQINRVQAVMATADIRDAMGVILVRSGQPIDDAVAEKIVNHQRVFGQALQVPIEQLVQLQRPIDGARLFHLTYTMFGKYPDLKTLHDRAFGDDLLRQLTDGMDVPAVLWQKLTVLAQQLPDRFNEALFCGWFSALIAYKLNLGDVAVRYAYIAGLVRDIGFLNIAADVLTKTGALSAQDWRAIQSHVDLSRQCLQSAQMPAEIIAAVAEHHERCDGSGYPQRLAESAISRLGLVVGLADTLQAMRFKQFAKVGRGLADAVPYLQMNGGNHGKAIANAAINLLRNSGLTTTRLNPCSSVSNYAYQITRRAENVLKQIGYLDQILKTLQILPLGERSKALIDAATQVQTMIVSSGLTRDELLQWLQSLQGQEDDEILAELNELDLMLNELHWHVQKLTRSIDAFFESNPGKDHAHARTSVSDATEGLRASLGRR